MTSRMLHDISEYYSNKLAEFGCTPRGVDWNGTESQENRFSQLMEVCKNQKNFTLGDYGCGYGALLDFLKSDKRLEAYKGFDISESMIHRAREAHTGFLHATFTNNSADLKGVDYLVASGVFNVRLENSDSKWASYIKETLHEINLLCTKGFSFNALTSYSDKEKMRDYLFYSDPLELLDYCKRSFSKQVALLHDYGLYEFTIVVRKSS